MTPAIDTVSEQTTPASASAAPAATRRHGGYRPEIDGLRAVAILPVLLFHTGLGFPGGYVGVDIFFVISGYLITSLIYKELEAGTFSLANFWERRARRIMPASLALTLAVLVAGWFLLLPADFLALGKSASAQAVFSSNVYFWLTANYFAASVEVMPLLHTWSLAVEEQFYVFFPLLLLGCYRSAWLRRRGALMGLFAVGFVLSLACSAYGAARVPTATFYLLPTRAWELLAGSLLAVAPASWTPQRRGWREAVSALGLLAIGGAVFGYDKRTIFPGLAALPPCLGAAGIIWSNGAGSIGGEPAAGKRPGLTVVGRLLASPGPVFIGLISYSLYLWHWPLLAFNAYWAREPYSLTHRLTLVGVSLALAVLSWWLVEGPFRKRQVCASRRAVLTFAACGLAAMLTLGVAIARKQGIPNRFPREVDALADARLDRAPLPELGVKDVLADHLMVFGVTQPGVKPTLFVWGDSHAAAALPGIDLYCKNHGMAGRAAVHSSTSPLLDYYTRAPYALNEKAIPFGHAILDYIQRNKIPRVLLCNYWGRDLLADPDRLERALAHTIEVFRPTGVKLYILLQVPRQPLDVPRALALDALAPQRAVEWKKTVAAHRAEQALLYRVADKYRSPQCVFIDPAPAFADAEGEYYEVIRDGRVLYCDEGHMSVTASTTVFERLLEPVLDAP